MGHRVWGLSIVLACLGWMAVAPLAQAQGNEANQPTVPEPASLALFGLGGLGVAKLITRRR